MAMKCEKIERVSENENFKTFASQAQTGAGAKMRTENQRQPSQVHENPIELDGVF